MLADNPFVAGHNSPQIRSIDEHMHVAYDTSLRQFASAHGYEFWRSLEDSHYNSPHRKLHRYSPDARTRYSIAVVVSVDMPQRLDRGWYPELPMAVQVYAASRGFQEGDFYTKELRVVACPFVALAGEKLREALSQSLEKHTVWTEQYLLDDGIFLSRRRAD